MRNHWISRWFYPRFGLRTLFVVVTAFSLWLGWQVHIVQERKAVLKRIEHFGGWWIAQGTAIELGEFGVVKRRLPITNKVGWIRTLLGDQAIGLIDPPRDSPDFIATIETVVPEAALSD